VPVQCLVLNLGGPPMRRREFISVIVSATAWPLAARAQQPVMPVIGFLNATAADTIQHLVAAFRRGLAEAGYVEGKNVTIEERFANFKLELLPQFASDL
jgi:putative tryptophan/tyrosine transport system substrate-binding protein